MRRIANKMRIAIQGCCHGDMEKIFESVSQIQKETNKKIDALIMCGDIQAFRNSDDLACIAVPDKYKSLGSFHKYYSGQLEPPCLTIVIGGNHEASNYMRELYHGGWLAPNIYYLGSAGSVILNGLRISGLSGIWKPHHYDWPHFENVPYDNKSLRSAYHIRRYDVEKLLMLQNNPPDIFVSHEWPVTMAKHGNVDNLLKWKPFFRQEVMEDRLGAPPLLDLLKALQPQYWFAAHLHVKYSALYKHDGSPTIVSRQKSHDDISRVEGEGENSNSGSNTNANDPNEISINDDSDNEQDIVLYPQQQQQQKDGDKESANPDEIDIDLSDNENTQTETQQNNLDPNEIKINMSEDEQDHQQQDTENSHEIKLTDELEDDNTPSQKQNGSGSGNGKSTKTKTKTKTTKFLALDKRRPKGSSYMQVVDIESPEPIDNVLKFDPHWLAIIRAFNPYFNSKLPHESNQPPCPPQNPSILKGMINQELNWVKQNIESQGNCAVGKVQVFTPTAPFQVSTLQTYNNPQTQRLCEMLQIEDKIGQN